MEFSQVQGYRGDSSYGARSCAICQISCGTVIVLYTGPWLPGRCGDFEVATPGSYLERRVTTNRETGSMAIDRTGAKEPRLPTRVHLNIKAQLHTNRMNVKERKVFGASVQFGLMVETQRLNATPQRHA